MNAEKVLDPVAFARELGRLHDMEISRLVFCAEEKSLCIHVDDLNANFSDLDEYKGCKPCRLIFRNVTGFVLDVETAEGIRIRSTEKARTAAAQAAGCGCPKLGPRTASYASGPAASM